jgi:hypothetical protein
MALNGRSGWIGHIRRRTKWGKTTSGCSRSRLYAFPRGRSLAADPSGVTAMQLPGLCYFSRLSADVRRLSRLAKNNSSSECLANLLENLADLHTLPQFQRTMDTYPLKASVAYEPVASKAINLVPFCKPGSRATHLLDTNNPINFIKLAR